MELNQWLSGFEVLLKTDMTFRNFDHLLTTRPHEINEVFISDLHLMEGSSLVDAFLALLDDLSALPNLKKLYILGDWFELWIGDDAYLTLDRHNKPNHWITPLVDKLKKLRINGCRTLVMVGNRDFLMRQPFCNSFAGEMIEEPYFVNFDRLTLSDNTSDSTDNLPKTIRLEHGDALCTDDKDYQRFRKYTRKPMVQWWFLHKPLAKRKKMASKLRNKSQQENSKKSQKIMDVNLLSVNHAFNPQLNKKLVKSSKNKNKPLPPSCDILIHGHTHRPAKHFATNNLNKSNTKSNDKHRYVLGDWRVENSNSSYEKVTAVIGAIYTENTSNDKSNNNLNSEVTFPIKVIETVFIESVFELFEFTWEK